MIKLFTENVKAWNKVAGVKLKDRMSFPREEQMNLMFNLLQEEVTELLTAMTVRDIVEVADALGDIIVICASTAAQYGIELAPVTEEVMRSNWTKFKEVKNMHENPQIRLEELQSLLNTVESIRYVRAGAKILEVVVREDGKIIKHPETYTPPKIKKALDEYQVEKYKEFFYHQAEDFFQGQIVDKAQIEDLAKLLQETAGY